MATFHPGNDGQTHKRDTLLRRERLLRTLSLLIPELCWGALLLLFPLWFKPPPWSWTSALLLGAALFLPLIPASLLRRRARSALAAATLMTSGIRGEEQARLLLSRLPHRVHIFPNRIVHAGNRSECDLVALCGRGLTIIEVKNHQGRVNGTKGDEEWTLIRPNRTMQPFANPCLQVERHARTLERALALAGHPCLVKRCVLFIREGTSVRLSDPLRAHRRTPVYTRRNRLRLRWHILHRGPRLTSAEVRALAALLDEMR